MCLAQFSRWPFVLDLWVLRSLESNSTDFPANSLRASWLSSAPGWRGLTEASWGLTFGGRVASLSRPGHRPERLCDSN
jgi:hypothetical protein